jgi:two-component system KDP operon response regulator KdpE
MARTILVLDRDPVLTCDFRERAEQSGQRVVTAPSIDMVVDVLGDKRADLVVVSPESQGIAGDELCRRVREVTDIPIAIVSSDGSESAVIKSLEAGADDYIIKPVRVSELDWRLRALLRRVDRSQSNGAGYPSRVISSGDLDIDIAARRVYKRGEEVGLSPTEFKLLATLAEARGRVLSPRAIIARVWGRDFMNEFHYLRLYVRYLRTKLEDDPKHPRYILNRWGSGYTLGDGR